MRFSRVPLDPPRDAHRAFPGTVTYHKGWDAPMTEAPEMKLLLDTHAYVGAFDRPERLLPHLRHLIQNPAAERWISVMAIGGNRGQSSRRLARPAPHPRLPPRQSCRPGSRLLIAQAKSEGLTIATVDPAFAAYRVATLW